MYIIKEGDTLDLISRKQYGNENQVNLLKEANPGIGNFLIPGTTINIPLLPSNATKTPNINSDNLDQVTMLIEDKEFKFFTDISFVYSMDNISNIEFSTPMESDNKNFRETFKPFSYKNVKVFIGNELQFNGTILGINPSVSDNSKTITVNAYAKCGVLNDCTASSNQFPLEFNNVKLSLIANKLIAPFGLKAIFDDNEGAKFARVAIEPDEKILSFLAKLANKRNLIITSNKDGNLLFQKAISSGKSVSNLTQGLPPTLSVSASFSPQSYYSHITGLEPVEVGLSGSRYTVKNTLLGNTARPLVFEVKDTKTSDLKSAVSAKMGRMFGNMVSYDVELSTWRDSNNDLYKPNTYIDLTAKDSMIYKQYTFLIKSVTLNKDSNTKTSSLKLILKESFTEDIPKGLPWEE